MSSETATGQECKVHVDINLVFDKVFWFYTPFHYPLILFIYFTWIYLLYLLHFFHCDKIISQMQFKEEADYLTPNPRLQHLLHVEVKAWTWKLKGIVVYSIKQREKWVRPCLFGRRPLSALVQARVKAQEMSLPTLVWVFPHKLAALRKFLQWTYPQANLI